MVGCTSDGFQFKPLVIGKSHRPRCFRGVDMSTLNCVYFQQDSAWMSGELMLDYFTQVVIPTIETKFPDQEVIITMDNARCHPPELLMNLHENIRVEFLPPNTTPLIQPCDQEVIFSLKSKLKEMYFNRLLSFIRENWQSEGDLYIKFLRQHSLLDSICDLCKAWFEVPQSIIKRSFNNLLKKKELSDSLYQAIDFEGFENRQIRDASFARVTDEDRQTYSDRAGGAPD